MKTETLGEPRNPAAHAASARTASMAAMRGPPGAAFGPERTRTSFVQATAPAQPMTASVRADLRRAIESPEGRGEGSKHALGSSDRQEKRSRPWGDHFPTQKVA